MYFRLGVFSKQYLELCTSNRVQSNVISKLVYHYIKSYYLSCASSNKAFLKFFIMELNRAEIYYVLQYNLCQGDTSRLTAEKNLRVVWTEHSFECNSQTLAQALP